MKREVHSERAEEAENRPDAAHEDRLGEPQEAQAAREVPGARESQRLRIRDPAAREESDREEDERARGIGGAKHLLAPEPHVNSDGARREERDRPRDDRDPAAPPEARGFPSLRGSGARPQAGGEREGFPGRGTARSDRATR